jgi:hypothetical protein
MRVLLSRPNHIPKLLNNSINLAWREESNWDSLLSNGTVNNPAKPPNNNTGIIYGKCAIHRLCWLFSQLENSIGDYYYIKAGNELLSQGLMNCSNRHTPSVSTPLTSPSSSQLNGATVVTGAIIMWTWIVMGSLSVYLIGAT